MQAVVLPVATFYPVMLVGTLLGCGMMWCKRRDMASTRTLGTDLSEPFFTTAWAHRTMRRSPAGRRAAHRVGPLPRLLANRMAFTT